jgi:hypothetical protein
MTKEPTYWTNTNGERHIATGADLEEILALIAESEAKIKADKLAKAEKELAKAALLDRLGITAEEAALLLA